MGKISVLILLICMVFVLSCSESYTKNFKTGDVNRLPEGNVDEMEYKNGVFHARGWSADKEDGAPLNKVLIYIDNKLLGKVTQKALERPDVAKFFNNQNYVPSGWQFTAKVTLSRGKHFAYAVAYDNMEGLTKIQAKEFVVE
jgi:hypothetical protein